jgi:biopolymer transport protein ExbD
MAAQLSGPGGGGRFDLKQNSDINVTPFVDVMLVLLIIFMVSAPLATVSIKVDLPPAVKSPDTPKKKPTFISIQKSGDIYLSGETQRKTSLGSLAGDLTGALGVANPQNEVILIRSDREVHYKDFMAVVNQLQTDGFYKVGLIIEDTTDA